MPDLKVKSIMRYLVMGLLLGGGLGVAACSRLVQCEDTVLAESPSPDGSIVAVVFERDCGATTAKNTQICFRKRSEAHAPKAVKGFVVFESAERPRLQWTSERRLRIALPRDGKVFRRDTAAEGIAIEYANGSE